MGKNRRRHRSPSPPSPQRRRTKSPKTHHHHHHHQRSPKSSPPPKHHSKFTSYLDTPNLPPKLKLLCEIVSTTPSPTVETVLNDACVHVTQSDVEEVLKLSYGYPGGAVKFFRWAGFQLGDKHSPYSWNLVVDLLGKNALFDAMWDAIKSMRNEGLLSLATFASVFSSYVIAGMVGQAVMTFEVMDQYGVGKDVVAVNSLVSAICRDGKTVNAKEFLGTLRGRVRLDGDTYAILLEGWENERDVSGAKVTFEEMVVEIGWDPGNVHAYNSFLSTLLKGPEGLREALKYFEILKDRRCYPGVKFFKDGMEECARSGDLRSAQVLWLTMNETNIVRPDVDIYNSMISLYAYDKNFETASRLLDEMVYNGVFPNALTYNVMFQFLVKNIKLKEAQPVFLEMVRNEFVPSVPNCGLAIRAYLDYGDSLTAIKIWKCMLENHKSQLEETGNSLVVGLRDLNRLPEAVKYAEDMIHRGIKLSSATLSKLRQTLTRAGKGPAYDDLLRKWKLR